MRVFLIGYMSSGKSKAGEQLAGLLQLKHLDTDEAVVLKAGKGIPAIFAEEGEEYFRKLESEVLDDLLKKKNIVVSTGGGLPCYGDNMEKMNAGGITVYLEANSGLLFHRLLRGREGRPLLEGLTDVELMEKINAHLAVRIPFYLQAQLIIPAANFQAKDAAARIKKLQLK